MKRFALVLLAFLAMPLTAGALIATNAPGYLEYKTGLDYYSAQKFLLSIGAFKKAIQSGMTDAEVYFYLGNAYLNNEDYGKSIESYQTAFESSLKVDFQAVALHNMAYAYYLERDYTNAIKYFNHAYELNNALTQTFWFKGMAYYQLRDKQDVIREWENYLSLTPTGEQSDNIRAALAILKADNFRFPTDGTVAANTSGTNSNGTNAGGVGLPGTQPGTGLIDVTGVLQNVDLSNRGAAEDLDIEDIDTE